MNFQVEAAARTQVCSHLLPQSSQPLKFAGRKQQPQRSGAALRPRGAAEGPRDGQWNEQNNNTKTPRLCFVKTLYISYQSEEEQNILGRNQNTWKKNKIREGQALIAYLK